MKSRKSTLSLLMALVMMLISLVSAAQAAGSVHPDELAGMSLDDINVRSVELFNQGNYETAFAYALYAANQGDAIAQNNVSYLYQMGYGVEEDPAECVRWARLAAEQGYAQAQNNLGMHYYNGYGVPQDYDQAFYWHKLAADQGLAIAQANLGNSYQLGEGVEQDIAEALRLYKLAAAQGDSSAFYYIGSMYEEGIGFDPDDHKALEWYLLAAEKDNSSAMNSIALLYEKEQGIGLDYEEAFRWFKQAADLELPAAQYNVGLYYENGIGVEQDEAEAAKWYNLAMENGFEAAITKMASLYEEGRGVEKDLSEALRLYQQAADLKLEDAQEGLERVKAAMGDRTLLDMLDELNLPATESPATEPPALDTAAGNTVSLTVEDEVYQLTLLSVGKDEEGKTMVTITGMGGTLFIRDGKMIMPVQMRIVCGEEIYEYANASVGTEKTEFSFETDQQPDRIYVYAYNNPDEQAEIRIPDSISLEEQNSTPGEHGSTADGTDGQAEQPAAVTATLTAEDGSTVTLTPVNMKQFKQQDDNVIVHTRIGDTAHNSGSIFRAGSGLRLSNMRDTKQYAMPMVAFTFESSLDFDKTADAIGAIGEKAVLTLEGNTYAAQLAWMTEDMACYIFNCPELPESPMRFSVQDNVLFIEP